MMLTADYSYGLGVHKLSPCLRLRDWCWGVEACGPEMVVGL